MPWQPKSIMNQKAEFVMRAQHCDNFRALCREYGISARTGYKWVGRFEEGGIGALGDRSRRPQSSPRGLAEGVVCALVRLKTAHEHWGPRKILELHLREGGRGVSESSVKRVLEKSGLVRKRRRRAAREGGRLAGGRRGLAPNEVWTVDFKGWWHDAGGRCEPLTVRDEYSRYVLELRALADARGGTVRECFERLFERHGLPAAIRSDNGAPFASANGLLGLSRLSAWWLALGIDLERGRPGCPQDNGAHERLHLDVRRQLQEAGYGQRQAAFDLWRRDFNEERPHEALGMRTPAELYRDSQRAYGGTPDQLDYEGIASRRVSPKGTIKFEARRVFLSTALAGWDVGLAPRPDGNFEVLFTRLPLGILAPASGEFIPARPATPLPGMKP